MGICFAFVDCATKDEGVRYFLHGWRDGVVNDGALKGLALEVWVSTYYCLYYLDFGKCLPFLSFMHILASDFTLVLFADWSIISLSFYISHAVAYVALSILVESLNRRHTTKSPTNTTIIVGLTPFSPQSLATDTKGKIEDITRPNI